MNTLEFIVLQNALRKVYIEDFLKHQISSKKNYCCMVKVSPKEEYSKTIHLIRHHITQAYSFFSIRGIILLKTSKKISPYDITKSIIDNENIRIYRERFHWYTSYVEGIPFFVFHWRRNRWEIFIPGAPTKPFKENKKHPLYDFLMSWPQYSESLDFYRDPILPSMKNSLIKLLEEYNPKIININNIQQKKYFFSNIGSFKKAFSFLFDPCNVFTSELHHLTFHRKKIAYFNSGEKKFSYKRLSDNVSSLAFSKGDMCDFLYLPNMSNFEGIENTHTFANYLNKEFPLFKGITSYCQKAFFECKDSEETFDEDTTLSYGHNTLKEKAILPISSVYLYYKNEVAKIFIWDKKLILLIVNKNLRISYNNIVIKSPQILRILGSLTYNYANI